MPDPLACLRPSAGRDRDSAHPRLGTVVRLLGSALLSIVAVALAAATASAHAPGGQSGTAKANASPLPADEPQRGLVFEGLAAARDGRCPGGYVIEGVGTCTHGPDAAPPGVDVKRDVAPMDAAAARARAAAVCGDNTGRRTQVIYARASDVTSRYAAFLSSFRAWAAEADQIYRDSAAETGGARILRFVRDGACNITVANVAMDQATDDDTFGATITELQRQGFARTDRKFMVFVDANVYCGIGNIANDDGPSANANDGGPSYGRTDAGCWGGATAAHEHMHNIGGVQLSAPHSSGGWHCVDEWDRMCYSDSPNFPAMQILCAATAHNRLFDCNHDDYFHTRPAANSYLATHWNAADSLYLDDAPRCAEIRAQIAGNEAEIRALQEELRHAPPGEKPQIIAAIRRLQNENRSLHAEAARIGCRDA